MWVTKEGVRTFKHGQELISTNAVKVIEPDHRFIRGILLRSAGEKDPTPNTGMIWIGTAGVTSATGMPIAPGETLSLPLDRGANLYAISDTANQSLAWLGV